MRPALLAIALLSACSKDAEPDDALVGVYRGAGRDALCIAREGEALKAGLIAYGGSDTNCSLVGRAELDGEALVLTPRGDSECSVEIRIANGVASLGARSRSCAYYCGPGADYAARVLRKSAEAATRVTDFAGEPLC